MTENDNSKRVAVKGRRCSKDVTKFLTNYSVLPDSEPNVRVTKALIRYMISPTTSHFTQPHHITLNEKTTYLMSEMILMKSDG